MEQVLNFKRLWLLIRKHGIENFRLYIFSALALLGLLVLVTGFWLYKGGNDEMQMFAFFLAIGGFASCVFVSITLDAIKGKNEATYWLSVPASTLEKLICLIFYSTILFSAVYIVNCLIVRYAVLAYYSYLEGFINPAVNGAKPTLFLYANWNDNTRKIASVTFASVLTAQAAFLLGATYFKRYSFVKTILAGFVIMGAFAYVVYLVSVTMDHYGYRFGSHVVDKEMGHGTAVALNLLCEYGTVVVFWVTTFFRLKEKEA